MKKNPASVPKIPNTAGKSTEPSRTGRADLPATPPPPPIPPEPKKNKPARSARKPLLDVAVETVKKMLNPKSAATGPSTAKSEKSENVKPSAHKSNGVEEPKVEVDATTVVRRTYTRKKKVEVPAILLEGDAPSAPPVSGPGEKFSLGATPPAQSFSGGELPASYGTKKLFLTARDPHWLYANWDLAPAQQTELNAASTDGHLILRIYAGKVEGHPAYEIHVHPESRHWFAHVEWG